MKIPYWHFENQTQEFLVTKKNECYIKDKTSGKYFYTTFTADKEGLEQLSICRMDFVFLFLLVAAIPLAIVCFVRFYRSTFPADISPTLRTIYSSLFLLLNAVLHELGHFGVMRTYHRRVSGVKFKMNFIYPTILVSTTDSYILPKYRKLFVYLAGIAVNVYLSAIVTFFFPKFIFLNSGVLPCIVANLLPIGVIKTDGYHAIINVLFNQKDIKKRKSIYTKISQSIFIGITVVLLIINLFKLL